MFNERWDRHFLKLALVHAEMSKDPRTRVGAVIVGPEKNIVSAGFNGFPRGIGDFPERLLSRELKLRLIVHAELNAILLAPHRPANCTLYLAITDDSGKVWGGPPCTRCTTHIIQSGITDIVSHQRPRITKHQIGMRTFALRERYSWRPA